MLNSAWRCWNVSKERRLGRGLEALLGRSYAEGSRPELSLHVPDAEVAADQVLACADAPAADGAAAGGSLSVGIDQIHTNPFQPRRDFDPAEIAALADSVRQHGMIQPILVRRAADGFQLIAGERRLRAAKEAGWVEVPAQIRDADDRQMAELAIVENLQRKDLNPLEKAASFEQYLESYGCTQEELAGRLNIDRSTVANLIRLLELPESVQAAIRSGQITQGHARAILPLGDEHEQVDFCERIQSEGLSVRATEEAVQDLLHDDSSHDEGTSTVVSPKTTGKQTRQPRGRNQQLASLEQEFRAALGTKVSIRQTSKGRGKIVIPFATSEEFQRLRDYLCGTEPDVQARAG
jgi:ParB family transcriptional regulator, chromosome partitioning protein